MDVRESVAFSLVTHFVVFLTLVTLSRFMDLPTAGTWAIDLVAEQEAIPRKTVEDPQNPAYEPQDTEKEAPAGSMVSDEEPPERNTAAEERPEHQPPPEPLEKAEETREETLPSVARPAEESVPMKPYNQFLRAHLTAYSEKAGSSILAFVNSEIEKRNQWNLNGLSAQVRLHYDGGSFKEFEVLSDSTELKWILRYVNWQDIPLPSSYFLRLKAVDVWITIKDNFIHASLTAM